MNVGRRTIRSYVLRAGRITDAQKRALDELLPRYGVPCAPRPLDLDAAFGRAAPRVLEVGFGNGDTLIELATASPGTDFIGVEVQRPVGGEIAHDLLLGAKLIGQRVRPRERQRAQFAHAATEMRAHDGRRGVVRFVVDHHDFEAVRPQMLDGVGDINLLVSHA